MMRPVLVSTVTVSWPALATKTRLPSGDTTTFHGSEPVVTRSEIGRAERLQVGDPDHRQAVQGRVDDVRVAPVRVRARRRRLVTGVDAPDDVARAGPDDRHDVRALVDVPDVAAVVGERDRARGRAPEGACAEATDGSRRRDSSSVSPPRPASRRTLCRCRPMGPPSPSQMRYIGDFPPWPTRCQADGHTVASTASSGAAELARHAGGVARPPRCGARPGRARARSVRPRRRSARRARSRSRAARRAPGRWPAARRRDSGRRAGCSASPERRERAPLVGQRRRLLEDPVAAPAISQQGPDVGRDDGPEVALQPESQADLAGRLALEVARHRARARVVRAGK